MKYRSSNSEVLTGTFPEVFFAYQKMAWWLLEAAEEDVPPQKIFHTLPPVPPTPPLLFSQWLGCCFAKSSHLHFPTEEMILLQSLLAKKVMDPSNFRDGMTYSGSRRKVKNSRCSTAGLSYPTPESGSIFFGGSEDIPGMYESKEG